MKKVWIGVDPGLYGAVAAIDEDCNVIHLYDMPTEPHGHANKRMVDAAALSRIVGAIVTGADQVKAFLEQSSARPGQGVSSTFSIGDSAGCARGVLASHGAKVTVVHASTWKSKLDVPSDKERCRARAKYLFPAADLDRKMDHGRAEALLIAYYGLKFG